MAAYSLLEQMYVHILFGNFCREDLVSSPHLFIYQITYLYQYEVMYIYFILWIILQCNATYFVAQIVLASAMESSLRLAPFPL